MNRRPRIKPTGSCVLCGVKLDRNALAIYCWDCDAKLLADKTKAYRAVNAAIAAGELQPARSLQCVDCGDPAREYDHRDYSAPLQVVAVCRSCNVRRGPAGLSLAAA